MLHVHVRCFPSVLSISSLFGTKFKHFALISKLQNVTILSLNYCSQFHELIQVVLIQINYQLKLKFQSFNINILLSLLFAVLMHE